MSQIVVDAGSREYVRADGDDRKTVKAVQGSAFYGGQYVDASTNDGTLSEGASQTISGGRWYFSTAGCLLDVQDVQGEQTSSTVGELAVEGDASVAGGLTVTGETSASETVEVVVEGYAASGSKQALAGDLDLAAGAGTSDQGDTSFIGGVMGNIIGSALTKTHNFIGGLIGAYSVDTSNASLLQKGAVVGVLMDGSQGADGIVVAALDNGDPGTDTNATAAFKAMANTNRAGTSVEYGLDLHDAGRDETLYSGGGLPFKVSKADVRLTEQIVIMSSSTAPVNGTTGDNFAGKGSLCVARDTGVWYSNTGAIDNPTWVAHTTA